MGEQRFSITPASAATDPELSDSVFRTLAVIGLFGDRNGWCWPSQKTIADLRSVSRKTVNLHIKELIERGYLNIQPRYDEATGAQKSNMMQVKLDFPPNADPCNPQDVTGGVTPKTLQGVLHPRGYRGCNPQDVTHNVPLNDPKEQTTITTTSSDDGVTLAEVYRAYENEIGTLSPLVSDMVADSFDDMGGQTVIDAIQVAARANVRKWSYVDGILKRWHANGKRESQEEKRKAPQFRQVEVNGQIVMQRIDA